MQLECIMCEPVKGGAGIKASGGSSFSSMNAHGLDGINSVVAFRAHRQNFLLENESGHNDTISQKMGATGWSIGVFRFLRQAQKIYQLRG
jgi:hypothetical protein